MHRIALSASLLVLAACQSRPIKPPQVVEVAVEKIVPVPAELTAPCTQHTPKANTVEEAVRVANARKVALEECSGRMKLIRELSP